MLGKRQKCKHIAALDLVYYINHLIMNISSLEQILKNYGGNHQKLEDKNTKKGKPYQNYIQNMVSNYDQACFGRYVCFAINRLSNKKKIINYSYLLSIN